MVKGKKRTKATKGLRNTKAESRYTKTRDMNSKTMFRNPILCSQFLRNNVDIPMLKDIRPEDIEDVSERYRPYLGAEFEADSVKQIKLSVTGEADDARKEAAKQIEITRKALEEVNQENIIMMCQELGGTKEFAITKLQEKCGLSLEEAAEKVVLYWKV